MVTWFRRLSAMGGTLVVLCFFLPWVLVSCSMSESVGIEASGYEVASGNYSELRSIQRLGSLFGDTGTEPTDAQSAPLLWVVPLAGLSAFLAIGGGRSGSVAAFVGAVVGMIGLAVFAIEISSQADQASLVGFQVKYRLGYWGSWMGFLIQAGAAGMVLSGGSLATGAVLSSLPRAMSPPPPPPMAPQPQVREAPAMPAAAAPRATLTFLSGPLSGRTIEIDKVDVMIGRSPTCDIRIKDSTVSRQHARLRYANGAWFIQDQGSSGGMMVNGKQVPACRLGEGDQIALGDSSLIFHGS